MPRCYCGHFMATEHTLRQDGMECDLCDIYHSPSLWNAQYARERKRFEARK